jgi:hypothetical protein
MLYFGLEKYDRPLFSGEFVLRSDDVSCQEGNYTIVVAF